MAITYSSGPGTIITSYAMNETLASQANQTGNNTVVVSNTLAATNNGQIGTLLTGYVGRVIIINLGGAGSPGAAEQTRFVTAETATGTGTEVRLTVSEDWNFNPEAGDTIHVFYDIDDIETGGAGGGVALIARTGFYEFSNILTVGNGTDPAGLQTVGGQLIEIVDSKSTTVYGLTVTNNARFQCGYLQGGSAVQGSYMTGINNTDAEAWQDWQAGSAGRLYDYRGICSINALDVQVSTTSDVQYENFSLLRGTYNGQFMNASVKNGSITGSGGANETLWLDGNTVFGDKNKPVAVINTAGLTHNAAGTETITTREAQFIGNIDYIILANDKIWNMVDPTWNVTSHTDINATAVTGAAEVNDRSSVTATVQQADGTKLEDSMVVIYEGLQTDDLALVALTDVNGFMDDSFIYRAMTWTGGTGSTTTYGLHAIRIFKYGYSPFVASQTSEDLFEGTVTLIPDPAITQSSQATAITNGAGITPVRHGTGETDTRPMKVMKYDGGTGSVPTVGETITQAGSPAATGVVVEYIGNAVSGTLVLESWNGVEFTDNTLISGGTSSFSATTNTAGFYQEYTWEIDCNSKSLSVVYDYLAARMAYDGGSPYSIDAAFEKLHEWGNENQGQALYFGTTGYYTENSLQEHEGGSPIPSEGVWLSNTGAGTIAYFTSDAGIQFSNVVAPIYVQGLSPGAAVKIIANETVGTVVTGDVILEALADANGEAAASINYEAAFDPSGLAIITRCRQQGLPNAAIQDDNGAYTDETTAANSAVTADMHLLPTVPVANQDAYLFGHAESFTKLKLVINTVGLGGFTITWQYWNGSTWASLSNVVDDTNSYANSGRNYVSWDMPGDWATTTVNGQGPFYYVRALYTAGTVTQVPLGTKCTLDVTRYLPFTQNGTVTSSGLTVTASWVQDTIATF